MNRFKKSIWLLLLTLMLLASCNSAETSGINPTAIVKTAEAVAWTEVARARQSAATQTPLPPTQTPLLPTETLMEWEPTLTPGPWGYIDAPPNADQQTYRDPEGWYIVNFPANMEATDKPNVFSLWNSTFETGYLPGMGYMSNVNIVCAWLANVELEPAQNKIARYVPWHMSSESQPGCSVTTVANGRNKVTYKVLENPGADPEHRFIFIKTEPGDIETNFAWLKPPQNTKPDFSLTPIPSAEAAFWENAIPLPPGISFKEYVLPPEAQVGPRQAILLRFVPEEAQHHWAKKGTDNSAPDKKPTVAEQLKAIGYKLTTFDNQTGQFPQLYRDGRILFDRVYKVSDVYRFSTKSGPLTAFTVATVGESGEFSGYLIQNDIIYTWPYYHQDPPFAPVLYQDELLWLRATTDGHIQVVKSDKSVVYSFAVYDEPMYSVKRFKVWEGHWILVAGDFLIQGGEILNGKLGFDEIFSWSLIKDKPAYFFRKGSKIGISYDGKVLPLQYQDVAHGLCCEPAQNNPSVGENSLSFFGKRDGLWYYVVVKFD